MPATNASSPVFALTPVRPKPHSPAIDVDIQTLEQLALDAARTVAGAEAVGGVRIEDTLDWTDKPIYVFTFLIDQDRTRDRIGIVQIRIERKIHDELDARKDEHYPMVLAVNRADWERRGRA